MPYDYFSPRLECFGSPRPANARGYLATARREEDEMESGRGDHDPGHWDEIPFHEEILDTDVAEQPAYRPYRRVDEGERARRERQAHFGLSPRR